MYRLLAVAMTIAAALGACQTDAQREAQQINDKVAAARAIYEPCFAKVEATPQFQGILAKMPARGTTEQPPLEVLANQDQVTPQEVTDLYAMHQARQPCRRIALESIGQIHPALVSIFAEANAAQDQDYVRLVTGEISWGDYAQSFVNRRNQLAGRLQQTASEIDRQLANAHAYELEQRQRASQALTQWSAQQQLLYQQQQMMGRPMLTNCRYAGTFLNCTTF